MTMFSVSRLVTSGWGIVGLGSAAAAAAATAAAAFPVARASTTAQGNSWKDAKTVYDLSAKDIKGNDVNLKEKYEGKVVLIVNVASK